MLDQRGYTESLCQIKGVVIIAVLLGFVNKKLPQIKGNVSVLSGVSLAAVYSRSKAIPNLTILD